MTINVLPELGRSHARKEYLLRLVTLACVVAGATALFACVALLPAYLGSRERTAALGAALAIAEASLARETESAAGRDIVRLERELPLLEAALAAPRPSMMVGDVLAVRAGSVLVYRFEYQGGAAPKLRVSGEADTRDSLIAFSRTLEQLRVSPDADLPVANLAKSEQVPFLITLSFTR